MLNKLYVKIKEFISENWLFFVGIIIGIFLIFYEFPYYINAPGGVIDVSSKVKVDGAYEVNGSFNMAYVTEYKATFPMLVLAKLNKNWDIYKEEILLPYETAEDLLFRDKLLLKEANQSAIIYAYKKAGKDVNIINNDIYVTYIYEEADTDLMVGDIIKSVNNIKINNKLELLNEIQKYEEKEKIEITVVNNGKEYTRFANLLEIDGARIIGIMISSISEYETNPRIDIHFSASESGPSGGLLMSLSIYNYLTENDITKGYKIAGTGTIDEYGNVGPIGGVEYKIKGAAKDKIKYFLIPAGDNYEEAIKIKNENNYDINIIPVSTFEEALDALNNL